MNSPIQRRGLTRWALCGAIASSLVLTASLFFWLWSAGIYYRPLRQWDIAVSALGWQASAIAAEDGVHFRIGKGYGQRLTVRWCEANRPSYPFGSVVNLLGLLVAAQPYTHHDGDSILSPNAAIALPYWLLIVLSGAGFLWLTGLGRLLVPYLRFGIAAWVVMIAVAIVFLGLNAVPSADRPGAQISESGYGGVNRLDQLRRLVFEPESFADIALRYGFPFRCYEVGLIDGQSVDLYHGAEMGLLPHKAAENLCIALGAMLFMGMATEALSRRQITTSRA
jgi:hypothetical protein